MNQKFLSVLGMFCMLVGISACDQMSRRSDKVIVAGKSGDNPPFEFFDTKVGELEGFSIDLMKAIAE